MLIRQGNEGDDHGCKHHWHDTKSLAVCIAPPRYSPFISLSYWVGQKKKGRKYHHSLIISIYISIYQQYSLKKQSAFGLNADIRGIKISWSLTKWTEEIWGSDAAFCLGQREGNLAMAAKSPVACKRVSLSCRQSWDLPSQVTGRIILDARFC